MKEIEVSKWKEKIIENGAEKEVEVTLLQALTILINQKDPNTMPKGMDAFRQFRRIAVAFDDAEKSGKLVLDSIDYKFLKEIIEREIPSQWGRNVGVSNAIEEFLNVK